MTEVIASWIAPYYLQIKFVHLFFVAMWLMSTSVAYRFYLLPIFQDWQRDPENFDKARLRNWAMERFDDGVILEHVAFPMLLLTGPLLMIAGGWNPGQGWFAMKMILIVLVFIPIEAMDYHLAHFALNKEKLRLAGETEAYEDAIHLHWWFLVFTSPIVIISIPYAIYLVVVKPF